MRQRKRALDRIERTRRERLASYKVPTQLAFRKDEGLPRTPTGKIHKTGLREQLAQKSQS